MKSCRFYFIYCILIICLLSGCTTSTNLDSSTNSPSRGTAITGTEGGYQYEINAYGELKLLSYNNNETYITVPETIVGKPVTTIWKDVFKENTNVVSITLPESLTTIEGTPFYGCSSLEEVTISKNLETISYNPFSSCSSLKKISVDAENKYFCDINGVLLSKDKTVLYAYPEGLEAESYTVPTSVKKIYTAAFGDKTQIKELTILSNVVEFTGINLFLFNEDITLLVESGSAAEEYAKTQGIKFEIIS